MQSSHTFTTESAVFDEQNMVLAAGLVPVLELAEQTGLSRLIGERVELPSTPRGVRGGNPVGKVTSIIAGMMWERTSSTTRSDPAGGMRRLFEEVYAPSTLGKFLREFTLGHANQLAAVAREHRASWSSGAGLLPGIDAARVPGHRFAAASGVRAG